MLRLASTACPFCEARAFVKACNPSWQFWRSAATLQKRKPSRMTLSPIVKRGPTGTGESRRDSGKRRESSLYGVFGGMNVTTAPRRAFEPAGTNGRQSPSPIKGREQARRATATKEFKTREVKTTWPDKSRRKDKDPMHALKMQSTLTQVSYDKRNRVKESLRERESFDDFDLLPVVKESIPTQALRGMVDFSPTPIQRLALPALLGTEGGRKGRRGRKGRSDETKEMQQFLLAAETGSGKTLAYLLPVIDALKRAEAAEAHQLAREEAQKQDEEHPQASNQAFPVEAPPTETPDPSTARPRALILLPTSELVDQVGAVVKNLSHMVKFRSALLSANYSGKVIRSRLFSTGGIDVVLSTPHLLNSIVETDPNILSRLTHLVIDEADSLLDRSFAPTTSAIVDRATPSLQQLILCSATIPKSLNSYLSKRFPDIRRLVTPNLHAIPRRVQLSVIDIEKVPYHGNRDLACAQVIWEIGKEASERGESREKKIVVFVNEREKTSELADYLRGKGIEATALSRDSDQRNGGDILASFTSTGAPNNAKPSASSAELAISPGDLMHPSPYYPRNDPNPLNRHSQQPPAAPTRRKLSNTPVLITTDLASRGIDTLPVKHVVLYDVPHTSIDFIHRLGRVGRMGRRGRGIVLVGKGDRRDVVREVREGMFKGSALI